MVRTSAAMPLDRQQREAWFSETVDPLLSEMEAKVVDTPDDPRAWMADYVDMDRDSGAIIGSTSKAGWGRAARTASADSVGRLLAAADATAAKKEEADTEAPEDVRDLNALLLPSGTLPLDVECFSVSYSTALFAGWVKQGSPCCAAASVAGAWNALSGRSRGVEGALSSELVLGAMRAVLEDRIAAMTSRFERLLGGSVAPLLLAITTELSRERKHLGGRGARAAIAKTPHLLRLTRSITSRELDNEGHSPTFDLLWELYEDEKKEAEASGATGDGLGTAMAAGRDRTAEQEAWTASVASEGAEDGISSVEDDVAAKHGGREESVGINTEDESGVGGANDAVSVVTLAGEERRHPRQSPSGRPKGIDPADKCGQRVALRPRVGHRREEGGGTIRTYRGGRGGQPRSQERTQGSREEREERYVGEEEVGEGEEEDEGEKVMCSETKGGVSGGVCGLKGASEQRRGRKPRSHDASSPKAKKGGGGEEQGRSTGWKWKKDLCSLLKLMGGLDKLCSKSPSTAAFGNAGLISTVRYLDGDLPHDGEVTARLFMGKGRARSVRLQVPLSAQDGEEEKAKQWAALREAFLTDRQVLLFHLTNHFALIFALREWRSSTGPTTTTAAAAAATTTSTATAAATVATNTATTTASATAAATATAAINNQQSEAAGLTTTLPSDSPDHPSESRYPAMPTTDDPGHCQGAAGGGREPVAGKGDRGVRQDRRGVPGGGWSRQMLTARRGQRPTAWVDFEEARRIMLGWEGYKIMTVRRGGAAAAAAVTLGGR